jgi:glycosyltransferase involved in cell wall biosynthesis
MSKISVLIIAKNEEDNIGRALKSVEGLDEVLVLDSGSSDNTPAIAQEAGVRLIPTDWPGYAEQRRRALGLARNDWCLFLDADEELNGELRTSLLGFEPETGVSGYCIKRNNYFLGNRLKHGRWANDRQLRLFLKSEASITQSQIHEGVMVNGMTRRWEQGCIAHHTAPSLQKYLDKQNSYTTLEARQKRSGGKSFSAVKLVASPVNEFLKLYLWQGGCWDGLRGFAMASLSALYKYSVWAKIYQAQKKAGPQSREEA